MLTLLNPTRRRLRWPLKLGIGGLVVLLVLFPRLDLLARNIAHWSNLGALIDPDAPGLSALTDTVTARLTPSSTPADALIQTQAVVYEAIPYSWDWDTWGVADYVPTVSETLEAGREDCDGRAVVAASILRRLGYDARLMSDAGHVWVWTPEGQTMDPSTTASGQTFVTQDDQGRSTLNWGAVLSVRAILYDWSRNLGYGIAVFPAWREAVILGTIWVLLLSRRPRWAGVLASLVLLVGGWVVIRTTAIDFWNPSVQGTWAGFLLTVIGLGGAWVFGRSRPVSCVSPEQSPGL